MQSLDSRMLLYVCTAIHMHSIMPHHALAPRMRPVNLPSAFSRKLPALSFLIAA
mgnify:CR=1 FL=1